MIYKGTDAELRAAKSGSPPAVGRVVTASSESSNVQVQAANRTLPRVSMEHRIHKQGATLGQGGADVRFSSPEIRNPLLNLVNFYLPYDRKTLNQWIRYYDRFQPYVGNIIDLHAEFPISDFTFTEVSDPKIRQMFEEQKEDANMVQFLFEASREYELLGEVFAFWNWDDAESKWTDYVILNPDLLEVKSLNWGWGTKTIYVYDPPQELKDLMGSREDYAQDLIDGLDNVIRENLIAGKKIPLDDFNMMSMVRRASPYESRGTSIVLRIIKELLYEDKIREAQYAIADQQITPVQLWKLGDSAAGYMPTEADLDAFRSLLLSGTHDPLFTIVTHSAVNLDLVGYTGKLLPVIPEFEWVAKRILVGLFASDAMISGGSSAYSNAIVSMKALQGRYQSKRDKLIKLLRTKLFEPICKAHQIFDTTSAELAHRVRTRRKFAVPGIEFNFKLDLTDQMQRTQFLMQLINKSQMPIKVIAEVLDIPYDQAKQALEAEEGTPFDPVYQAVRMKKAVEGGGPIGGGPGEGMGGGGGAAAAPAPAPEAAPAEEPAEPTE